jgi:GDPmannose 4,6-dehydratase
VSKRALIFGIAGQDGSYLAELLLDKGYEVHGTHRRSSYDNLARLTPEVRARVTLHRCELTDAAGVVRTLETVDADEVYNLADQDEVSWSRDTPGYSVAVTYGAPATVLEWLRANRYDSDGPGGRSGPRFFQPVSSTMFGPTAAPQNESTPLNPGSPYACAKAAAFLLCRHYRREHDVYVSCGIMFNHDSPRRGPDYLLQRIARQAVAVARGERERIELTGPDALVDVGWAPDYVDAAWRTLQRDAANDYVIGTGCSVKISGLCRIALRTVGCDTDRYRLADESTSNTANVARPDKAREKLNWSASFIAEGAVATLVRHFKEAR